MTLHRTSLISASLIGCGLLLAGWQGNTLRQRTDWHTPLNPLGINRSPFGEVFAMALQGPINTDFHAGMYGATDEQIAIKQREHAQRHPKPGSLLLVNPAPDQNQSATEQADSQRSKPLSARLHGMIDRMQYGHTLRTNPLPASEALKFYLRRKAEDKLRFAYQLDPAHYANYNSLHFFLTEGIGTRPELTPSAAKLARETIDYCLSKNDDPRPALTAAAASTNILHLLFNDYRKSKNPQKVAEMKANLEELDRCIERYHHIAKAWDQQELWNRLSPQRVEECANRITFITRIRNAAEETIRSIEKRS